MPYRFFMENKKHIFLPIVFFLLMSINNLYANNGQHIEVGAGVRSFHGDVHESVQYNLSGHVLWEQNYFGLAPLPATDFLYGIDIGRLKLAHNFASMTIWDFSLSASFYFKKFPFFSSINMNPFLRLKTGFGITSTESTQVYYNAGAGSVFSAGVGAGLQIPIHGSWSCNFGYFGDMYFFGDGRVWDYQFFLAGHFVF